MSMGSVARLVLGEQEGLGHPEQLGVGYVAEHR